MMYTMDMQMTEPQRVEARFVRNNLSRLLDGILMGHSYLITRHGREIAQLVPVSTPVPEEDPNSGRSKLLDKIQRNHDDDGSTTGERESDDD